MTFSNDARCAIPMLGSSDTVAYVARWSHWTLLWPVPFFAAALVFPVLDWLPNVGVWLVTVVFSAAAIWLAVTTIRRIRSREVAFAVDSRGVYLGSDHDARKPEWQPWSTIDAVIHYRRFPHR